VAHIDVFKGWAETIRADIDALKALLEADKASADARKLAGAALSYLVSKMDLIPDWNEGIGVIDDVMVLRVMAQLSQDTDRGPLSSTAEASCTTSDARRFRPRAWAAVSSVKRTPGGERPPAACGRVGPALESRRSAVMPADYRRSVRPAAAVRRLRVLVMPRIIWKPEHDGKPILDGILDASAFLDSRPSGGGGN